MIDPLVSIIMPVHNGAKYIGTAIQSVVNQGYQNWELIIINDGSIDNTEDVVFSIKDHRIKYFKLQENIGVSAARNVGLQKMIGSYFCFLDSDDVFTSNSISARIDIFNENPNVNFVDGKVIVTGSNINDVEYVWEPKLKNINPQRYLVRLDERIFVTISWMFKRKKGTIYSFQNGMTHAEDLWFFIQYSNSGHYMACNETILYFRRTNQSAMSNLKGLENGYLQLLKLLDQNIGNYSYNRADFYYTRLKIIKIMFLSYLSRGQLLDAFNVFFKLVI